jgi:hypothetical protein
VGAVLNKITQFKESIEKNDLPKIKSLLNDPDINPSFDNNWAILHAAKHGYINIIELLLNNENFNFSDDNLKWAISFPATKGDIQTLKAIINIEKFDITEYLIYGVISAAENGHADVVELLISDKRMHPLQSYLRALTQAYKIKHHNVVELLWKKTSVRHCIKKYYIALYNELSQKYIKHKIDKF